MAALGGMACPWPASREVRGEDCREPRLGGGGGATDAFLSPWNGGGTPNFGFASASSSIGVFGGLGGGGGPGFTTLEAARFRFGRVGAAICANLPASASGGGALNW